jgi:hypothetical protein
MAAVVGFIVSSGRPASAVSLLRVVCLLYWYKFTQVIILLHLIKIGQEVVGETKYFEESLAIAPPATADSDRR